MTTKTEEKTTPMMVQWHACKEQAKDALLLFRLGDFYEAFHEDAKILASALDLTLTKRQNIPMSGIPWHSSDAYIDKLIAKGYKVAIAEQTSEPKPGKGLVSREVVRIVTPGSITNSSLLQEKSNNFFASIAKTGDIWGLAFVDITTGECFVIECEELHQVQSELHRIGPKECLISERLQKEQSELIEELKKSYSILFTSVPHWHFEPKSTFQFLIDHLGVKTLDGFGLQGMVATPTATGALLQHLKDALHQSIHHILEIHPYSLTEHLQLDATSQKNLELTESMHDGTNKHTLLSVIDQTATPMGGRLIRKWIKRPLLNPIQIKKRQGGIQSLLLSEKLGKLEPLLSEVRDLERLMMRICCKIASPRDLLGLSLSFNSIPELKQLLSPLSSSMIQEQASILNPMHEITGKVASALNDDPPTRSGDGGVIRDGYHKELDELRSLCKDSKSWLIHYQEQLKETNGIKTLKVGYNKMFGFYIEVSKGQVSKVPPNFHRKQTLVNAERYITDELKEYESKVLNAEERAKGIESELFEQLRCEISRYAQPVLQIARAIATIDALYSLSKLASDKRWCCPKIDTSDVLQIRNGKHPVIATCDLSETFVPNDTNINDKERLLLITGPNMAGKSTYIRQVALICILAQMGSFVPADEARIGILDRIFTRVGASDDLSRGQSTFMVEMTETANILHNATSRSLVILDEIGRGTSTYDGISIAWAVAEHLLNDETRRAKTLFATHYFELTKLEEMMPGAVNYHVAVNDCDGEVLFLRKILRGGVDRSYGIHVAKLAGMPHQVIERAEDLLIQLEKERGKNQAFNPKREKRTISKKTRNTAFMAQMNLFQE